MKVFKTLKRATRVFLKKHGSQILTGTIIAGSVVTVGLTIKATKKSIDILEKEKEETGVDKIPVKDVVKLVGKEWIPTAASLAVTVGSAVGLYKTDKNALDNERALSNLTEAAFTKYRNKVIEKHGKESDEEIRKSIVQDDIDNSHVQRKGVIEIDKTTDTWIYEPISQQWFYDNYISVMEIKNKFNDMLLTAKSPYLRYEEFATLLNEFGIDDWETDKSVVQLGQELGFRTGHLCDYHLEEVPLKVGGKGWSIVYEVNGAPIRDYEIFNENYEFY